MLRPLALARVDPSAGGVAVANDVLDAGPASAVYLFGSEGVEGRKRLRDELTDWRRYSAAVERIVQST